MSTPLALQGGPPALPDGPPPWPVADEQIAAALNSALADGSWGRYHGPHVERLVEVLCEYHQVPFAYPCCSGTYAVELALRGLNVGERDEVVLAGYDFPGNFRSIEAVGARPVLVDIDESTWCLDAGKVEEALGSRTRAVIVSHLHAGVANMRDLAAIARRKGIAVVEDACQAPGAMHHGRMAGTWGDVGVLSFGGSKLLTAGRGGALLTQREDVLQRLKIFGERGNVAFPLSELQAAVLPRQLDTLAERNLQRRKSVRRLIRQLEGCDALRVVETQRPGCEPSFYKLAWSYRPELCGGRTRDEFIAAIQAEGVAIDAGFRGFVHRGRSRCRRTDSLVHSDRASRSTLLLHHPVLLEPSETLDRVAEAIQKVVRGFRGGEN
ncbi:MAG: DegT/DnrJ/EryC1/StrS family aminotransferase [Pirellulaceae bacterium]